LSVENKAPVINLINIEKVRLVEPKEINIKPVDSNGDNLNVQVKIIGKDKKEIIELSPKKGPIKKIEFSDLNAPESIVEFGIDDVPKEKELGFVEIYAIDPTELNFTAANVTVVAKGSTLYKCKDWNFTEQECYGEWKVFKENLIPGKEYVFILTPDDPGFGEINATNATHLDSNYGFISDIFRKVEHQDNNWSEPIYHNEYIRVTFEENLTNGNLIDLYARNNKSITTPANITANITNIEIYEKDSDVLIGVIENIVEPSFYYFTLSGMNSSNDVFDFKIVSEQNDSSAYLEFDYMHDAGGAEGIPKPELPFFMIDSFGGGDKGIDGGEFDEMPIVLNDYGETTEKCELWDCSAWTMGAEDKQGYYCSGGWNCTNWNGVTCSQFACEDWSYSTTDRTITYCSAGWDCGAWNGTYCEYWNCTGWTEGTVDHDHYCSGEWDCSAWNGDVCDNWNCTAWSSVTGKLDRYCSGEWDCSAWNGTSCDSWNCTQWSSSETAEKDSYPSGGWNCTAWSGDVCDQWQGLSWTLGADNEDDYYCDQWNCSIWDLNKKVCQKWDCLSWLGGGFNDRDFYCSGTFTCNAWESFNYTAPASVTNLNNQSQGATWIYWNWTNPADDDFEESLIFKNSVNIANTSNNFYNMTGLTPETSYTITVHTRDNVSNVNDTDVNSTASTTTDTTDPVINSISDSPDPIYRSQTINITANITDNVAVDTALLEFEGTNYTMNLSISTYYYDQLDTSGLNVQTYDYTIYANDTSGNPASSVSGNFTINKLFFEGFESNSLATNNWTTSGAGDAWAIDTEPYEGTYNIVAEPVTAESIIETSIDTTNHDNINLTFYAKTVGLDAGEYIAADWYNGTAWTQLMSVEDIADYTLYNYSLPSAAENNADFKIRFRCLGGVSNEKCYVDNVEVYADLIISESDPPQISLINPENNYTERDNENITFIYNVSDESNILNCTIYVIDEFGTLNYSSTNTTITKNTNQTFLIPFEYNGNYIWNISCFDANSNQGWSENRNIALEIAGLPAARTLTDTSLTANDTSIYEGDAITITGVYDISGGSGSPDWVIGLNNTNNAIVIDAACGAGEVFEATAIDVTGCTGCTNNGDGTVTVPDNAGAQTIIWTLQACTNSSLYSPENLLTYVLSGAGPYTFDAYTGSITISIQDPTAPSISLNFPGNNYNTTLTTINFNWTAIDNVDTNLTCNLTIDGIVNASNIASLNNTATNYSVSGFADRTHNWSVTCWDDTPNTNTSEIRTFTIDTTPPAWSNNKTSPASGTAYSSGANYQFNITWTDAGVGLDTIQFEHNFTGTPQNVTYTGSSGSEYYLNYSDLAAGSYYWKSHANDTLSNENTTDSFIYTVAKATTSLTLTASPSWNETYGTQTTVNCSADNAEVNVTLFRDAQLVGSSVGGTVLDVQTLAANTYTYICNNSATQNYTADSETNNLTIAKAAGDVNLYLNGSEANLTVEYPTQTNATATTTYGIVTLYRDGTNVTNPEITTLSVGYYNYTAESSGDENHTSASITYFLNITVTGSAINLLLNGQDSNVTINQSDSVEMNATLTMPSSGYIELYQDGALINNGSSPLSNTSAFANVGTYNITALYPATVNYSGSSETHFIIVNDITDPSFNEAQTLPTAGSQYNQSQTIVLKVNATDNVGISLVYANIEWSSSSQLTNLTFNATSGFYESSFSTTTYPGLYNITYNATDTSGNSNTTQTNFTINDITNPAVSDITPAPGTGVDLFSNLTITVNVTDPYYNNIASVVVNINNTLDEQIILTYNASTGLYQGIFTNTSNPGIYNITIIAIDNANNVNNTETSYFNISDVSAPSYSNIIKSPADNGTYTIGQSYQFNITWTDNLAVDTVTLEFDGTNYTPIAPDGNVYSKTFKHSQA